MPVFVWLAYNKRYSIVCYRDAVYRVSVDIYLCVVSSSSLTIFIPYDMLPLYYTVLRYIYIVPQQVMIPVTVFLAEITRGTRVTHEGPTLRFLILFLFCS